MEEAITNHIIHFCSQSQIPQAISNLSNLKSLSSLRLDAFAALLGATTRHRLLPLGRSLHRLLLSSPNCSNIVLSNHLINLYCKCSRMDSAHKMFDEMPHRNLISWTALIAGYAHHGLHDHCFSLFSSMLQYHLPNEFALSVVLASAPGSRGRQVHALVCKTSFDDNVFVGNALIKMYANSPGYINDGWLVFKMMPSHNLVTWNSVIVGFPNCSFPLFREMRRDNWFWFDQVTLVSVIFSCRRLTECMQLHLVGIKSSFDSDNAVATALIKGYSGLGGDYGDCYKIFYGTKERDIVSWTTIMASCVDSWPEEAMVLFTRMRWEGLEPDRHVLSVSVKACSGFATERPCTAMHSLTLRSGFGNDVIVSNALIHAYARCGSIVLARNIFEQMTARDIVSWNSMIKGFATHGEGREALRAFRSMDVVPDPTTFVGLLTACSHSGLLDEGCEVFESMSKIYGVDPQLDHYACMVDILGRAGKLAEAEELIDQMPVDADFVVWSSLLGACRKHREGRIGEKAARKLVELDPQKSVGYVMMSNIYGATRSFRDADFIRKEMKGSGVKKELGLSWIAIGNHVHEFSAGGKFHPQIKEIQLQLKELVGRIKKMGYVPDTSLVLHDIDENHKEERLLHHSEKLALVFGVMNVCDAQTNLIIMKNIRICEDCHRFMKLASICVEKKIVIRDSSRFHHFNQGECSCGEYW